MVSTRVLTVDDESLLSALRDVPIALDGKGAAKRAILSGVIESTFAHVAQYQRHMQLLRVCYSVKTNPSKSILKCARRHGLFAEVISPAELEEVVACGFRPSDVVYNGPYPAQHCTAQPGFIFADSLEAYSAAALRFPLSCVGVRLRPPDIPSRFGIRPQELAQLAEAIEESGRRETAISFHVRPEDYGNHTLRTIVSAVIDSAQNLERQCGVKITAFDIGGGKRPSDFDASVAEGDLDWIEGCVRNRLVSVDSIFVELGQALVTSGEAVICSILEIRRRDGFAEAVVDAGYPEVSQIHSFEHRLFHVRDGIVRRLDRGADRILGRTCLEYDVISISTNLTSCRVGDLVAIADAGAYDSSMSFTFAQGEQQ